MRETAWEQAAKRCAELSRTVNRVPEFEQIIHAACVEYAAQTLAKLAHQNGCPYIVTTEDGTSHCKLAEKRTPNCDAPF